MVPTHQRCPYQSPAGKFPSTDWQAHQERTKRVPSFISSLLLLVICGCIWVFFCCLCFFKAHSLCPQDSMDSLYRRLERSKQMQTVLRAFEARDRNLLEDNLWRVSFWSCASVLVMLCVALTQVCVALTRHTTICWVWSHLQSQKNEFSQNHLSSCRSSLSGSYLMTSGGSIRRSVILPKENQHSNTEILDSTVIWLDHFCSTHLDEQPCKEWSKVFYCGLNVNIEPQTNKEMCSYWTEQLCSLSRSLESFVLKG